MLFDLLIDRISGIIEWSTPLRAIYGFGVDDSIMPDKIISKQANDIVVVSYIGIFIPFLMKMFAFFF